MSWFQCLDNNSKKFQQMFKKLMDLVYMSDVSTLSIFVKFWIFVVGLYSSKEDIFFHFAQLLKKPSINFLKT